MIFVQNYGMIRRILPDSRKMQSFLRLSAHLLITIFSNLYDFSANLIDFERLLLTAISAYAIIKS